MDQEAIDQLRQPHPAQSSVDARSASLLRRSERYSRPAKGIKKPATTGFGSRKVVNKTAGLSNLINR